jgi:hypothetical protein
MIAQAKVQTPYLPARVEMLLSGLELDAAVRAMRLESIDVTTWRLSVCD